jgi:hypothetical protein
MAEEPTPYRHSIPRAEAAIFRSYVAHTGAGGMGGPALATRYALGVLAETAGSDPNQQAELLRQWARILLTAAGAMETA